MEQSKNNVFNLYNWKAPKESIMEDLANWELVQEQRILSIDKLQQKTNLATTYEQVAKNEEIGWRQR